MFNQYSLLCEGVWMRHFNISYDNLMSASFGKGKVVLTTFFSHDEDWTRYNESNKNKRKSIQIKIFRKNRQRYWYLSCNMCWAKGDLEQFPWFCVWRRTMHLQQDSYCGDRLSTHPKSNSYSVSFFLSHMHICTPTKTFDVK